jgi:hypothetical protein
MTTRQNSIETILAAAGAGVVLYFCFTKDGQAKLRQLERWVDEGMSESSRLMETFERVAMIASAVGGVVGLVAKAQNEGPHAGHSAAIENLMALPRNLKQAGQRSSVPLGR